MTNTQDLWDLLRARENTWVPRVELNFVGGMDTGRRLRELRDQVSASGSYVLDERKDKAGALEFRLRPLVMEHQKERWQWRCTKCESYPRDVNLLTNSIDPRWKIGRCHVCGKVATFRRVE